MINDKEAAILKSMSNLELVNYVRAKYCTGPEPVNPLVEILVNRLDDKERRF